MKNSITVTLEREGMSKGPESKRTVSDSIEMLVVHELAFGGKAMVEGESIVVRTNVFGSIDITTFSGTPEAMRPLHQALTAYQQNTQARREVNLDLPSNANLKDFEREGRAMVSNRPLKHIAIAAALDPNQIETLARKSLVDLLVLVEVKYDDQDLDGYELLAAHA